MSHTHSMRIPRSARQSRDKYAILRAVSGIRAILVFANIRVIHLEYTKQWGD
ncbi:hypothetical protein BD311DRAFT_758922 [Dichomitus squalens]|uniref:Uncharacterized protein n=1 Tax=Dichomitus squalens TaxID=114155 RepID=A0A4Q9MPM6_9APHY|nr:hypothetical protein BD311DRAFT_758922 [Dichomitus squalens]